MHIINRKPEFDNIFNPDPIDLNSISLFQLTLPYVEDPDFPGTFCTITLTLNPLPNIFYLNGNIFSIMNDPEYFKNSQSVTIEYSDGYHTHPVPIIIRSSPPRFIGMAPPESVKM